MAKTKFNKTGEKLHVRQKLMQKWNGKQQRLKVTFFIFSLIFLFQSWKIYKKEIKLGYLQYIVTLQALILALQLY